MVGLTGGKAGEALIRACFKSRLDTSSVWIHAMAVDGVLKKD